MEDRRRSSRAGFVLAGGRSSRMGQDKALLPWKGSTLIQSVLREVFNAVRNVSLICAVHYAPFLPDIESAIHSKLLKMHDFISVIQARLWPAPDPAVFRNINTPRELSEAR